MMDYYNLPSCALFRHGTMVVRLRMEVPCECGRVCPVRPPCLPRCELCCRTRTNSQYSDCDSGKVLRCRPYRARAARSRFVNVCAAVCLILLVGGLTPSHAAPQRRMDRSKKDSDQENGTWGNPCEFNESEVSDIEYTQERANKVAVQARHTRERAESYKDEFAQQLHGYSSFTELLGDWKSYTWMEKWSPSKDIVPDKEYGQKHSDAKIVELVSNINDTLPSLYKGLKMVVSGLYAISEYIPPDLQLSQPDSLHKKLMELSRGAKSVLCYFQELMRSRKLELPVLLDKDVPELPPNCWLVNSLLVYRDSLNYLEYIEQVFDKLKNEGS